jgi:hypothetical protein
MLMVIVIFIVTGIERVGGTATISNAIVIVAAKESVISLRIL